MKRWLSFDIELSLDCIDDKLDDELLFCLQKKCFLKKEKLEFLTDECLIERVLSEKKIFCMIYKGDETLALF